MAIRSTIPMPTGVVTLNLQTNVNNQSDTLSGFESAIGSGFDDTHYRYQRRQHDCRRGG